MSNFDNKLDLEVNINHRSNIKQWNFQIKILIHEYSPNNQVQPFWDRVDLGAMAMKGYSRIPQSSSITGTSPSDYLVSYLEHSLAGVLTTLQRRSWCILQPQPTKQHRNWYAIQTW